MADGIEGSISRAINTIANYVDKIATMEVETRYFRLDDQGDGAAQPGAAGENTVERLISSSAPVAYTRIKLDGDSLNIIPLRTDPTDNRAKADTELYAIHQGSVNTTIEYRRSMLNAMLDLLRSHIK